MQAYRIVIAIDLRSLGMAGPATIIATVQLPTRLEFYCHIQSRTTVRMFAQANPIRDCRQVITTFSMNFMFSGWLRVFIEEIVIH